MTGPEMMINTLLKALKIDPDVIKGQVEGVASVINETGIRMERMERKLDMILRLLGTPELLEPQEAQAVVAEYIEHRESENV